MKIYINSIIEMIDKEIFNLIPHRPPMLLLNRIRKVGTNYSEAEIDIHENSTFLTEYGVPSYVGIEYMGQTAALIAGYQKQQGELEEHLGFLMAVRFYHCQSDYFKINQTLLINCQEQAVVGNTLATFACEIKDKITDKKLAEAQLSVFRQKIERNQTEVKAT